MNVTWSCVEVPFQYDREDKTGRLTSVITNCQFVVLYFDDLDEGMVIFHQDNIPPRRLGDWVRRRLF